MAENRTERLVRLISANQDDLYRYIYSLLPHNEDAKDVLQETALAITGKFDEYDSARPFLPWACKFAYHKVMQHRDRNPRRLRYFAPDVMEMLAGEREGQAHLLQARLVALDKCLEKLPLADRSLLTDRYNTRLSITDLAVQVRQSRRTLLRNLQRLRHLLYDCMGRHALIGDGR